MLQAMLQRDLQQNLQQDIQRNLQALLWQNIPAKPLQNLQRDIQRNIRQNLQALFKDIEHQLEAADHQHQLKAAKHQHQLEAAEHQRQLEAAEHQRQFEAQQLKEAKEAQQLKEANEALDELETSNMMLPWTNELYDKFKQSSVGILRKYSPAQQVKLKPRVLQFWLDAKKLLKVAAQQKWNFLIQRHMFVLQFSSQCVKVTKETFARERLQFLENINKDLHPLFKIPRELQKL